MNRDRLLRTSFNSVQVHPSPKSHSTISSHSSSPRPASHHVRDSAKPPQEGQVVYSAEDSASQMSTATNQAVLVQIKPVQCDKSAGHHEHWNADWDQYGRHSQEWREACGNRSESHDGPARTKACRRRGQSVLCKRAPMSVDLRFLLVQEGRTSSYCATDEQCGNMRSPNTNTPCDAQHTSECV